MTGSARCCSDVRGDNQTPASPAHRTYSIPPPVRRYTTTNPTTHSPTYHLLYDLTRGAPTPVSSIQCDSQKVQSNPVFTEANPPSPPLRPTGSDEATLRGSLVGHQFYLDTQSQNAVQVDINKKCSSGGFDLPDSHTLLEKIGSKENLRCRSNRPDVTNQLKGSRSRGHVTGVKCQQTEVNKRREEIDNNNRAVSSTSRHHTANISAKSQPHKSGGLVPSSQHNNHTSERVKRLQELNEPGVGFPQTGGPDNVTGELVGADISKCNNGVDDNTAHRTQEITGDGRQLSSLTVSSDENVVPWCSYGLTCDNWTKLYSVDNTDYNTRENSNSIQGEHSLNTLHFELSRLNKRAIFQRSGESVRLVVAQHDEDLNNDSGVVSDNDTLTGVVSTPLVSSKEKRKSAASGLSLLPGFLRSSLKGKSKKKFKVEQPTTDDCVIRNSDVTGQRSKKQLNRWDNVQLRSSRAGHNQGETRNGELDLPPPPPVDLRVINTSTLIGDPALYQQLAAHQEKKETLDTSGSLGIKGILVNKESRHTQKVNSVQFKDQQNSVVSVDQNHWGIRTSKALRPQLEVLDRSKYIIRPREIVTDTQTSKGAEPSSSSQTLNNHQLLTKQSVDWSSTSRDHSVNDWLRESPIGTSFIDNNLTHCADPWLSPPTVYQSRVSRSDSTIAPKHSLHSLSHQQVHPPNTSQCFTPQSEEEETQSSRRHRVERCRKLGSSVQKKILAYSKATLNDHKESPRAKFERDRAARTNAIATSSTRRTVSASDTTDRTASSTADRTASSTTDEIASSTAIKTADNSASNAADETTTISSTFQSSHRNHPGDFVLTPPPLPPRIKCLQQPHSKSRDTDLNDNCVVSNCQSLLKTSNTSLVHNSCVHIKSVRQVENQLDYQTAGFEHIHQSANFKIQENKPVISHCNEDFNSPVTSYVSSELNSPVTSGDRSELGSSNRSNILNISDIVSQNEYIRQVLNQSTAQQLRSLFGQEYDDLSALTSQSTSVLENVSCAQNVPHPMGGGETAEVSEVFQDKTSELFSNTRHISSEHSPKTQVTNPTVFSTSLIDSVTRLNDVGIVGGEQHLVDKKTLKQPINANLGINLFDIVSSHPHIKTNNRSGKDQCIIGNVRTFVLTNPSQTDMLASKGLRIYDSVDDYVAMVRSPIHKSLSAPQFTWEGNTYLIVPTVLEDEAEKSSRGQMDAGQLSQINLIDFVTPSHDRATLAPCQTDSGTGVGVSDDTATYITMTSSVDRSLSAGHRAMSVEVLCASREESSHRAELNRVPRINPTEAGYVEWRTCSGWVGQTDLRPTVDQQNSRGYVEWDTIWSPRPLARPGTKEDDHVYDVVGENPSSPLEAAATEDTPPALPERTYIHRLKHRSSSHLDSSQDPTPGAAGRHGHSSCHCPSYGRKHHHHHHHRHNHQSHSKVHTRPPPLPPTKQPAPAPPTHQEHLNLTKQTDPGVHLPDYGYNYAEVNKLRGYTFSNTAPSTDTPPKPHRPEHSATSSENYCRLAPETSADSMTSWQSGDLLDFIDGLHDSMSAKRRENIYILLNNKKTRAKFSESLEIESRLLSRGLISTSTLVSQSPTASGQCESCDRTAGFKPSLVRRKGATAPVSSTYV